jgi:predicted secreted protein
MFTDMRSKKIVFVAHCILNQNALSDGTADFPGTFTEIVRPLLESDVGIVQLPCPELLCLGVDRGDVHGAERPVVVENTRIRDALQQPAAAKKLKTLVDYVIVQIDEYSSNDFSLIGIIGVNRSPSCGIDTTSMNNREVRGKGIFMETLRKKLTERQMNIPMIGVKSSDIDSSVVKVTTLLEHR